MSHQQSTDLNFLRGEAQGIHKSIRAAVKVAEVAAKVELFKKAVSAARQLHGKVKEASAIHQAERKSHLHKAEAALAAIAALHTESELKHKADAMLDEASQAVKHITEAIAVERRHSTKSSAYN